jgi:hypothetical protein
LRKPKKTKNKRRTGAKGRHEKKKRRRQYFYIACNENYGSKFLITVKKVGLGERFQDGTKGFSLGKN